MRLLLKLLKKTGLISKILPGLLRAAAEGGLGPKAKAAYWALEGKKTLLGAVLIALGTAAESLAASYPDQPWIVPTAQAIFWLGALLSSVGLVDGGVRSPWPQGTEIPDKAKHG